MRQIGIVSVLVAFLALACEHRKPEPQDPPRFVSDSTEETKSAVEPTTEAMQDVVTPAPSQDLPTAMEPEPTEAQEGDVQTGETRDTTDPTELTDSEPAENPAETELVDPAGEPASEPTPEPTAAPTTGEPMSHPDWEVSLTDADISDPEFAVVDGVARLVRGKLRSNKTLNGILCQAGGPIESDGSTWGCILGDEDDIVGYSCKRGEMVRIGDHLECTLKEAAVGFYVFSDAFTCKANEPVTVLGYGSAEFSYGMRCVLDALLVVDGADYPIGSRVEVNDRTQTVSRL